MTFVGQLSTDHNERATGPDSVFHTGSVGTLVEIATKASSNVRKKSFLCQWNDETIDLSKVTSSKEFRVAMHVNHDACFRCAG